MMPITNHILRSSIAVALATIGGCAIDNHLNQANDSGDVSAIGGKQPPRRVSAELGRRSDRITDGRSGEELFRGIEQTGSGNFVAQKGFTNIAAPERTPGGEERVTLNLLNVPLAQAAKSVIGDVLKANYTIADKLTGNITIQTTTPMQRDAVLDVFESALKVNGAALVRTDGHYRIVAAASAAQSGARVGPPGSANGAGIQVLVVPLKFASPSEMRRVIEPVAPQGGILSVDDTRNILVLSGTARELNDMQSMVTLFDVDWMRGMSVALYPVKSSDPDAISRELETVLGLDRDGPLKGSVRVIPNKRLSAIMVVSSRPGPLEAARKWLTQLDKVAESSEEQLFVYRVRNRNALELANLLSRVTTSKDSNGQSPAGAGVAPRFDQATQGTETSSSNGGSRGTTPAAGATAALVPTSASTPASPAGGAGGAGNGSSTSSLTTGSTSSLSEPDRGAASQSQSQSRGQKIVADEANSSLLITATRKEYDRMLQILDRMDILPTQIMLEALIAEVTLNDELKFGVKWAFNRGRHTTTLSDVASGAIGSSFPGFSYLYLTDNVTAAIDAVSSITKVNIVSAPSLMVLDNRKASLQIGDQVPIVTQQAVSTLAAGAPVVNSVTLKDTGIILNVVPHVTDGGRVVLEIEQEVSNVTKTTSSGIDSPTIQQRKIHTSVVVDDGQFVALGGMIQERDGTTKSQVPLLGDIPILGAVFRQKSDDIKRTELLIFIRPQVIRNSQEATDVTEEFRRRINLQKPTSKTGRDSYDRDARRILR